MPKHNTNTPNKILYIHEHNAGAGKTFAICSKIKNSNKKYLISVPTKKLQVEYSKLIPDALVINDDNTNVNQYIAYQQSIIDARRVVIITHVTLLTHGDKFGQRELIIDELPSDLICTKHLKTTASDAVKLEQEIKLSSNDNLRDIIKRFENGSAEHSDSKIELLSAKLNNKYFAYEPTSANEYVYFHYLFLANGSKFENYSIIHLLGANLSGSIAIKYFTDLAGYKLAKGDLVVRGNPMDQKVRIVPLLKFENGRDFISKPVLEKYFTEMLKVVRDNTKEGVLIATNNDFKPMVMDAHFKVITPKSHGLNEYKDRTQAAVLYSANPNPYDIPFMQTCAEVLGFDSNVLVDAYVFENVLDVVYQTVTRTAIRNPEYEGELTFFVPDSRCADFLRGKFKNAHIDWSLAIDVAVDKGGAQSGNTNKKSKGCAVTQLLTKHVNAPKAKRLIDKFSKDNGFAPNALEPIHIKKLIEAATLNRVPKDYSFKI
ncbi:hypothetical protein [Shewanella sp.]|uniref:hypothetical protein n=1 Tax=Shewanella sp. TaxID=50422 RepID=UPI003A878BA6